VVVYVTIERYIMELFVSVLGLMVGLVGLVGVYFSYESYKVHKNTDC